MNALALWGLAAAGLLAQACNKDAVQPMAAPSAAPATQSAVVTNGVMMQAFY
ncbi:hypothetical protein N008_19660 [Hymenobacter sp. APR13]|nr:hypothetical protein N008_19660 [Hymenobacter sp. APR13]